MQPAEWKPPSQKIRQNEMTEDYGPGERTK